MSVSLLAVDETIREIEWSRASGNCCNTRSASWLIASPGSAVCNNTSTSMPGCRYSMLRTKR